MAIGMIDGRLYTVTELAKELGMTARAIRFYEHKGLITPPRAGTTRVYSVRDRARMILIQRGKRLGFSLSAIREYLDLYDADVTHHAQRQLLLGSVAKRRDQLLAQRKAIDEALSELDDIAAQTLAAQAEAAQTEATQTEAAQTEARQTEAGQTEAAQTEAAQTEVAGPRAVTRVAGG